MANANRLKLQSITLSGFKSFDLNEHRVPFGDTTILLGANGAGKSNLVSFFYMVNHMTTGGFENIVAKSGFASSILHYGPKQTREMKASMVFADMQNEDQYDFTLSFASPDRLIFTEEVVRWKRKGQDRPFEKVLEPGGKESELRKVVLDKSRLNQGDAVYNACKFMLGILSRTRVFHFHDTSSDSAMRRSSEKDANTFLYHNGGNIAAYLYDIKQRDNRSYERIVKAVQRVMPQFFDFELQPEAGSGQHVMLKWRDKNYPDYLFGPHQISDGSLRFIALATLLLQPSDKMPNVIILDEPELGLHPQAIVDLAGMIRSASRSCQVVVSTQSPRLVDEFQPSEVVVVERNESHQSSEIKQLDSNELNIWLNDFRLSELWERNFIGGKP